LYQRVRELEQQIDIARQERQQYLEQIGNVRPIRTNPAFGQERRQVAELGRSLVAVERQLDALQAELEQTQAQLQALQQDQRPELATPGSPGGGVRDQQGHDAAYWQGRFQTVRNRLRQAQEQRQALLEKLAAELDRERSAYGRLGREVVRQTQALQQVEQELHAAEAALQDLSQEARRAGAPAEWWQ
jgi:DNA repair exonuclease SbcCD ATPase subunit